LPIPGLLFLFHLKWLSLKLAHAVGDQQLVRNLTREITLYDSGKPLREGQ
jgi:hypothetical protein